MYGLKEKHIKAINSVFSKYTQIEKTILYGSRAKGNYRNGSDIDLTLVGDDLDLTTLFKIETILDDLLLPYKMDLSILHKIENPDLQEHIKRVGIIFYLSAETQVDEKVENEWKEDELGDVLEIKYGKDHKKLPDGKTPCYGSGGIMRYVTEQLYDKESILIPRKGSLNNIYYINEPFWTVDTLFWSKIDTTKVFPKFLFYQLTEIDFTRLNVGSAVPSLTVQVLNELKINLPDLSTQKSIAEILTSLDDKIDLLHRQNKTLEAMAETLYDSWVSENEFESTIKDLIDIQNGYAFKSKSFQDNGSHRVLKIKNISGGIVEIQTTDFVSDSIISSIDKRFVINTGDILFAMTGAKIGKMGIIPQTEKSLWLNQRVGLFKEKYKGARFLAYLHLKSNFGVDYIENTATGSAQPNISGIGIENCEFPNFSEQLLLEYSEQFDLLFSKVIFNLGQIRTLEKLRNTLLPKLMSGEVGVKIKEQNDYEN